MTPSFQDPVVLSPEPELEAELLVEEAPPPDARPVITFGSATSVVVLTAVIAACSIYANLSYAVTDRANLRYFPPFRPHVNGNMNDHLGAEYYNIAKSMVAGEGFASPFKEETGPTAWMPPILPAFLAALLWLCDGNQDAVMTVVIFVQVSTLIGTGLLVLALAWQTTRRVGVALAAAFFLAGLIGDFRLWFQQTHDHWIVLLAMDCLLAGFCWLQPLHTRKRAAAWGVCGGLCAMINPITAFTWGILCLAVMVRQRAWTRGAIAFACAGLALTPWTVRNYLVFGRLIPVKSNAAYELWQSQCLTPDGLLQPSAFGSHPYVSAGRQRQEYKTLGEMEFLDKKQVLFQQSIAADPLDFVDRVACRFLGATVWYMPFNRVEETRRPWLLWVSRIVHPLPFLAGLFLLATAFWQRTHAAVWGLAWAFTSFT